VVKRIILVTLCLQLVSTALSGRPAFCSEFFSYKPHAGPFEYHFSIQSHAVTDSDFGVSEEALIRDHEDILTLSQNLKDAGDGLLNISTTVKKINFLPPGPTLEAAYKRQEIEGNVQHTKINLQGNVVEAKVIPHIGSRAFWRRGEDGPPLDIYNILLMLHPRFPLGRLDAGSAWEVNDEIELRLADALPADGGLALTYDLEMTVKQKIKYNLIGFEKKKGFGCARIGVEVEFRTDGVMRDAHTGSYVVGNGKSSGEVFFAPKEGVLVEASLKHHVIERLSKHEQIADRLSPEEPIPPNPHDQESTPIPWRTDRTVTLELIKGM
jgi:hypothetical protein